MADHRPRVLAARRLRAAVCGALVAFAAAPAAAEAQYGPQSGVVPASHRRGPAGPSFAGPPFGNAAYAGPQYGTPEDVFNGPCPDDAYVTRRLVPDPQAQYGPRPPLLPGKLKAGGVRARLEYRQYWFSDTGSVPIGARLEETTLSPFFNITTTAGVDTLGVDLSEAFDTNGFGFDGVNAIGANIAFDTGMGAIEVDGFATEQVSESFTTRTQIRAVPSDVGDLTSEPALVRPAVPLQSGVNLTESLALPFDELTASQTNELFGVGATWVTKPLTPNVPLLTYVTVGGRYLQYTEHFGIRGAFRTQFDIQNPDNPDDPNDRIDVPQDFSPRIDSRAINHIFGPTIGMRFDLPSKYVSLGIEPRFGFGISRRVERVSSEGLVLEQVMDDVTELGPYGESEFRVRENEEADLAPFFELNAYGRVHLRPNFNLFAGYNLLLLSRMSTAARQIEYTSAGAVPLINLEQDTRSILVHGLMVGGEWTFGG